MTVTVVFGKTSDGYLHSYDPTYSTARNGPADGVNLGANGWTGQHKQGSSYGVFEMFGGFDYPAIPASEVVTSCAVRTHVISMRNPSLAVDLQWRGAAWSGSGLTTADWRTPAQLSAARYDGGAHLTSGAVGKNVWASSDELLAAMKTVTSMEHVLVTNRTVNGTTPTTDEGIAVTTAEADGTANDPAMVYTSAVRSTLFGVLGAQVEVSDGWAYLETNAAAVPTVTLKHRARGTGTITTIGNLAITSTSTGFYPPTGAQHFALVADDSDNLYVLGRFGTAENALAIQGFKKGSGATWTALSVRAFAMPTYGAAINQVVATYHSTGGGTIFALVSHVGSFGDSVVANELQHAAINVPNVINASASSIVRGSGNSISSGLQPFKTTGSNFNTWHNETGSGLDVATAAQTGGDAAWGYLYSFPKGAVPGDNHVCAEGRYILATTGASFSHTSYKDDLGWARKDASGKVRVIPVSETAAAFISADEDAGWGLTIHVQNHNGSTSESVSIGYATLSGETATIPDGPVVGQSLAWDAVYNATENRLWIYYVSTTDSPAMVRRTAFDLTTMQPTQQDVTVTTMQSGDTIHALRVQRNKPVGQDTLVSVAWQNGATHGTWYAVDTFNIAPTKPTTTPKANFDATTAQTFAWTFNDPNPGDTQSAYRLEIERIDNGVVALDTGKVASTTPERNVAGGTLTNGIDYRWRVRTWDAQDEASPASNWATFSTSAGGNVTITSPATDNPLDLITDDLTISWSASGTVQAAYRVWLYRGDTLVSDTGWVASTATSHTVSGMLSDVEHTVQVRLRNASNTTTNLASRLLTPSYSTPEKPIITATPVPGDGYVLLSVENPAPGAPALGFAEYDFDTDTENFTPGPNTTVSHETTTVHRGAGALRMTSALDGQDPVYARGYDDPAPVVPGQRYTVRMWVWRSVAGPVSAAIDWNGASGYMATSSYGQEIPGGTWVSIQATGTAPEGAVAATYGASLTGGAAAGTYLLVDELVLTGASDRPDVARNEILRRPVSEPGGAWEVIGETGPDGTFRDYTAAAGVRYHYIARGQA